MDAMSGRGAFRDLTGNAGTDGRPKEKAGTHGTFPISCVAHEKPVNVSWMSNHITHSSERDGKNAGEHFGDFYNLCASPASNPAALPRAQ